MLVYVTGVSWSGKSWVLHALRGRGYVAVGDEDNLALWTDRVTGEIAADQNRFAGGEGRGPRHHERYAWRFIPARVAALAEHTGDGLAFVCGAAEDDEDVAGCFDLTIALHARWETAPRCHCALNVVGIEGTGPTDWCPERGDHSGSMPAPPISDEPGSPGEMDQHPDPEGGELTPEPRASAIPDVCGDPYARRAQAGEELLANLKDRSDTLQTIRNELERFGSDVDGIYRYWHQSFKVYRLQTATLRIVAILAEVAPAGAGHYEWDPGARWRKVGTALDPRFCQIVAEGTGHTFELAHNEKWQEARRIVEAYFHARWFLDQAICAATTLEEARGSLPSGWAALLELYGIR